MHDHVFVDRPLPDPDVLARQEDRRLRLDVATLAVRVIEHTGEDVIEAAERLIAFVEGKPKRVGYEFPGGVIVTAPPGVDPRVLGL
ncbi:hypothetical protein I5H01_gp001 [Mycobacterium phage MarkPhew]|uniref:Gene 1 ring forming protein domain-containing protein n=1 Tax=Mycobacterium phage MarkPhew TaxID=2725625 RepID=A0A6M3SZ80_9CAUD|nr:hypothetical protein I5H01_gp001 [Mycobacterium phage MarkPhew]QJD50302.1 hypothetical protein SEA_MARKPHEW_1 [Mycobacterium phage MarkPhew]